MLKTEAIIIRPGTVSDTVAINRIYNHFILHTTVTFDIKPWDDDKRRQWIRGFTCPHFLLVAEYDSAVIGFCCNHQLRPKAAYDLSTEVTIYTAPSGVLTGTGALLYKALFVRLIATPLHRAYAIIALPNNASVACMKDLALLVSDYCRKWATSLASGWMLPGMKCLSHRTDNHRNTGLQSVPPGVKVNPPSCPGECAGEYGLKIWLHDRTVLRWELGS